jgi:outer membrane protein
MPFCLPGFIVGREPNMIFAGSTAGRDVRLLASAFSLLCVLAAVHSARAQSVSRSEMELLGTLDTRMDSLKHNEVSLDLGAGPILVSRVEAQASKLYPVVPYVSFRYSDWFALDENEARVNLIRPGDGAAGWRAGPMIKIDIGRPQFHSPDLSALPKIAPSLEAGAFASYTLGPARARVEARTDITGGHGAIVEFNLRSGIFKSGRFGLAMEVEADWLSRNYMQAFFGVDMTHGLLPRLTAYTAGAGFRNIDTALMGQFQLTPHWSVIGVTQFSHLLGAAADSPLTLRRGATNKINLGTFVVYTF